MWITGKRNAIARSHAGLGGTNVWPCLLCGEINFGDLGWNLEDG